ncbi:MAG: reverse transcriptase domain-containing protein [Acidobacteriota bacterium]
MLNLVDIAAAKAKKYFLKGSSYLTSDLPSYMSFEPILTSVDGIMNSRSYPTFKKEPPESLPDVNYSLDTNKDGRFSWRPYELIHPALYVSLVNLICLPENWNTICNHLRSSNQSAVEWCSPPLMSTDHQKDQAIQIRNWWQQVEQRSLELSLEFNHLLQTDVSDCYGSLYTHSIPWALHGLEESKNRKRDPSLLGNRIDKHIQASRYGQTNGIPQGSTLMDLVAEIVLVYVDSLITESLKGVGNFKILRYRDDYRIFTNDDSKGEFILKVVSHSLRRAGMKLGTAKTTTHDNVIEGSIKRDKLAGIDLQDLGTTNAKTAQKQLLRLHSFGRRFPNSGSLRRLVSEFHSNLDKTKDNVRDLDVLAAIATDIAVVSPATFPAVAGILSRLISFSPNQKKAALWKKVQSRLKRVPYNGYLQIWLQRIAQPLSDTISFKSEEPLCQIIDGEDAQIWNNSWISSIELKKALGVSRIRIGSASEASEIIQPEEVELFRRNALRY